MFLIFLYLLHNHTLRNVIYISPEKFKVNQSISKTINFYSGFFRDYLKICLFDSLSKKKDDKRNLNLINIAKGRAIVNSDLIERKIQSEERIQWIVWCSCKKRGTHLCTFDQLLETWDYSILSVRSLFSLCPPSVEKVLFLTRIT